jgi:DNA-binding transcriptional LysR family regulator
MDKLAEMRVFVRAIERGTFASAAGDLGLTPSAVSKLIARLEARLGVRLVNRTTRKLSLTAEGETYFHSGRQLVEAMDNLEQEVAAAAEHPRGLLRINTALSFGVQHLTPALIEFHRRYPDVRISISLTERPVDVHAEQIDVAVRVGPSSDQDLMSRKVGNVSRVLCASPQYLAQFGVPERREDLGRHRCIAFTAQNRGRWPFRTADGGVEHMEVSGVFASDNQECILQLVLNGAGIGRLGDYIVARPIRDGRLVALLADQHDPEPTPAYAVFPSGTHKVPKLRVFLDFLVERFGGEPARRAPRGSGDRRDAAEAERSRG